ncbi:MAG: sigma-70 family RNA polymerase sigma factor [Rhodospirillaceae bacterium]|nr:sigma-70 family RNA polymerase sigma factor [Rhodospirillaceae bacterium]
MPDHADGADWPQCLGAIAALRDRAAFEQLFAHFAPRIKTLMRRSGLEDAAAEELAQEALLVVWRKAHMFDPSTTGAAAWIFTIARNLRIDALRRARGEEASNIDAEFLLDSAVSADAVVAAGERESRVRTALATLPADQVRVVELSFYHEQAHGEIAAALGIPLGTVKSRLRLATAKLRGLLGDLE